MGSAMTHFCKARRTLTHRRFLILIHCEEIVKECGPEVREPTHGYRLHSMGSGMHEDGGYL